MSIHGKLKTTRFKIFDKFRSLKTTGLLVCTDVMARGIDIADIDWVFQFDAPSCASDFVHRCGRTARIGNRGTALAFLQPNEEPYVHFIDINQKVTEKSIVPRNLSNRLCLLPFLNISKS
jgi:ATP-dependent RNA helicase DDX55/SPB4